MQPSDSALLVVFYAFSLAGQLVLTACLLTVFIARIQRDLTLINPAVAGLLFATACLMLLFSNEFRGPEPQFNHCLAQACMIYGSLAMAASSVCCLFLQLWYSLRGILHSRPRSQSNALGVALKILPWLSLVGMSLASLIEGLRDRKDVTRSRDFFYCSSSHRVGYASEILCGTYLVISLFLELHIAYMLLYGWKARTLRKDLLPVDSIVRLGLFSLYASTCITAVVILVHNQKMTASPRYPFLFMSTIPLAIWLVFWTQKDVWDIWTCRRLRRQKVHICDVCAGRIEASKDNMALRERTSAQSSREIVSV